MKRTTTTILLWATSMMLSPALAGSPAHLDPGDGSVPGVATVSGLMEYSMTLQIAPGSQAPLRPLLAEYHVSVRGGELSLVMHGMTEVMYPGETHLIPTGMDFTLLNRGSAVAEVLVTVSFAGLDFPLAYPAQDLA